MPTQLALTMHRDAHNDLLNPKTEQVDVSDLYE
jgi:hypothetical protein